MSVRAGQGAELPQSRAPGRGQVEHDGRVHGLEVDGAGRGVDEGRDAVCHHSVAYQEEEGEREEATANGNAS